VLAFVQVRADVFLVGLVGDLQKFEEQSQKLEDQYEAVPRLSLYQQLHGILILLSLRPSFVGNF
jgi:hypothetical protein